MMMFNLITESKLCESTMELPSFWEQKVRSIDLEGIDLKVVKTKPLVRS